MNYDPEYNYYRAIDSLRISIRHLVGSNLADQQQIKDHVKHLRHRIEVLKDIHNAFQGEKIGDDPIDHENPPVSRVDDSTLVHEAGLSPAPSADPGNGMMPEPADGYLTRGDFRIATPEKEKGDVG